MTSDPSREPARTGVFHRDRLTFSLYGAFIVWGWYLYTFSPTVPLIADDLKISSGLAGLHGTAMAVGSVISGLVAPLLALHLGRRIHYLIGSCVLLAGTVLLVSGAALWATLPACLLVSLGGSLTVSAAQPALMAHHGIAGPAAVTEGNGVGSGIGLIGPLALGATVSLGWGWRPAVGFTAVLAVVAAIAMARLRPDPALDRPARPATAAPRSAHQRYSSSFWLFWAALVFGTAIEFSTVFWTPDLLSARTGAGPSLATAAVAALVAGMTTARFVLGPLAVRKGPETLLLAGFVIAGAGWVVFWFATWSVVAFVGLFLAGLGYGTHYPLGVSLIMRCSDGRPDKAQGLANMGAGLAVGLAPFGLGAVSDAVGPHKAFLMVGGFIACGTVAVALGRRQVRRTERTRALTAT